MKNKSVGPSASKTAGKEFQTFEDLEAYKVAREFRKAMYGVARRLPDLEKFGLAAQIRRAAVSLTNNIAEGHGRFHYLDQIKFMLQVRGSPQELIDDLNVCEDEKYSPTTWIATLKEQGWNVLKFINGYLRWLRDRKAGQSLGLREDTIPYGDTDDDLEAWLASLPL
jgi:four helix bundle protein